MAFQEDRTGGTGPGADAEGVGDANPNRAMDQDRAGDVRPGDGRPAAGGGFGPQVPVPQADEGERGPER